MPEAEASTGRPWTLLIVDDHEVVRQGLVAVLGRRPEFSVVAEAGTVAEAVEAARRFRPDLVVMDVRLPDGSGVEACREIRGEMPETRVVMLTSYPDEDAVLSAIIAGASGYLLKQTRARDLVAALEAVGRGESLLDPAVTGRVLERVRRIATADQPDELAQLTAQEQKILLLVAEGKTNKEIAGRGLPVGQDGQELRQLDPGQAQPRASRPGGGLHGQGAWSRARQLSRLLDPKGDQSVIAFQPIEKTGGACSSARRTADLSVARATPVVSSSGRAIAARIHSRSSPAGSAQGPQSRPTMIAS